jgi:hypothetical protein
MRDIFWSYDAKIRGRWIYPSRGGDETKGTERYYSKLSKRGDNETRKRKMQTERSELNSCVRAMTRNTRNAIDRRNSTLSFLSRCVTSFPGFLLTSQIHRAEAEENQHLPLPPLPLPLRYRCESRCPLVFLRHISPTAACSSLTHTSRIRHETRFLEQAEVSSRNCR